MSRAIHTTEAPEAVGPYNQAMVANGFVFTAGQIALTPDGGDLTDRSVEDQAEQCLRNLEAVLAAADVSFDDVVKTTVYLADIDDYGSVNGVYGEYFDDEPPARSAVGVADLPKKAAVEMEAVAVHD